MFKFFTKVIMGLAIITGILNACLIKGCDEPFLITFAAVSVTLMAAAILTNLLMRNKRLVVRAKSKGADESRKAYVGLAVYCAALLFLNYHDFYGPDRYVKETAEAVNVNTGILWLVPSMRSEEHLSKAVCQDMVRQMEQYVQDTDYKLYEYPVSQDTAAVELSDICSQLNSFVQQLNEVERGSFEELQQFFAVAEQIEELPLKTRSMTEAVMFIEFILLLCIFVALLTVWFDLLVDRYIEVNGGLAATTDLFKDTEA